MPPLQILANLWTRPTEKRVPSLRCNKEPTNILSSPKVRTCPAWTLLRQGRDPSKGAISWDHGFMGNPQDVMSAEKSLPAVLKDMGKEIPSLYADEILREKVIGLKEDFHSSVKDLQGWDLLLAKSTVFILAQAFVDCKRQDRGPGKPVEAPPPFPESFEKMIQQISARVNSVPFCTLSDICLYNITFHKEALDSLKQKKMNATELTIQDMDLRVPVLNGFRNGETGQKRMMREHVESRFFLATVEMGYASCDMPRLVAESQNVMKEAMNNAPYKVDQFSPACRRLVQCLNNLQKSAIRMKDAFEKLNMKDVPAKVWHKDVAKLTLGYNGNGGPSGPQHPTVHLLDIFLGRKQYNSELGTICLETRSLLAANHREFLQAVQDGPLVPDFLKFFKNHTCLWKEIDLVRGAYLELIEAYTTSGFLSAHRKKAYAFLRVGFSGQIPRTFTAGSTYDSEGDVSKQMYKSFSCSIAERKACADLGL